MHIRPNLLIASGFFPGTVAAAAVPEPSAALPWLAGIAGLVASSRRRIHQSV